MASTLPPPAPTGGNLSWASQSSVARGGWDKSSDSGVNPRSTNGGKAGGRAGRGGRGGRGANRGAAPIQNGQSLRSDESKDKPSADSWRGKPDPLPQSKPTIPPSAKSTSRQKPAKVSTGKLSRKASANAADSVPAPVPVNPSTTNPTGSRSSNRRKRSHSKAVSNAPSKSSLSSESSLGQTRSDTNASLAKDPPPHLSTRSEQPPCDVKKNDIAAFVERVRAVAMSDRPHTPGSHFDWASDDDDSLPDLPDWGLAANYSDAADQAGKINIISPILEDALKPLPSLDPSTPVVVLADNPVDTLDQAHTGCSAITICPDEEGQHLSHPSPKSKKEDSHTTKRLDDVKPTPDTVQSDAMKPKATSPPESLPPNSSPTKTGTQPLHPSLPPKPATIPDSAPTRHTRHGIAESARNHISTSSMSEIKFVSGVAQSIHAPPSAQYAEKQPDIRSPERGLAASIHAPVAASVSAPSHTSTHLAAELSNASAHNRSRTLTRGHRQPYSASVSNFPSHLSDADHPARGDNVQHARTHSTPPTGSGTSTAHARSIHVTRPVITVDAISRLARTLGGAPPKRESGAAASAKD